MTVADELYDKNIECPVCNSKFATKMVRTSKLRLIKQDGDFMPYYEGENPIKYKVFVCPECGYAATEERYKSILPWQIERIKSEITPKWNKRNYGNIRTVDEAIETCKLALYEGQVLDYKKVYLGSIALNIAWLFRLKEDKEQENRFLENARKLYELAYYKEDLINTNMNPLKLSYLIGELYRRLGNKNVAIKWFNSVLTNPQSNSDLTIKKMATKQWRLARES